MTKSLAAAWLLHAAHATDYWMAWPDHYARGGGLGNQLEQILGRVQCAGDATRTLVLPDLRADRSSVRGDARHHAFERVFDVGRLRTVANVATNAVSFVRRVFSGRSLLPPAGVR